MADPGTWAAIGSIAASAATIGTSIGTTVQAKKAQDKQLGQLDKQAKQEERARELARKNQQRLASAGSVGTILAPVGLGGKAAVSTGKTTLLGG